MNCKCYFLFFTFMLNVFPFLNGKKLETPIDLTWSFENNTIYWSGVQRFVFTKIMAQYINNNTWLAMNEFCAGEHGGTHMDAPYHFDKNGKKLGQIPLKDFIVPGIVVDVSKEVETIGPNFTLQSKHIKNWEEIYTIIPENAIVLVKFGWSKFYPDRSKYLGPFSDQNILEFPGISAECAEYLTTKSIVGIGVDTASIDAGMSTTFDSHKILTNQGFYLLENVKMLEDLPENDFILLALPMNIAEGTGGPLRLVALPRDYFTKL